MVLEIALSLVLLTSAGLLMRSFVKLQTVELGLDPERLLFVRIPLAGERYKTAASQEAFLREALPRVRALAGVDAATTTTGLPLFGGAGLEFDVPGTVHDEKWNGIFQLEARATSRRSASRCCRVAASAPRTTRARGAWRSSTTRSSSVISRIESDRPHHRREERLRRAVRPQRGVRDRGRRGRCQEPGVARPAETGGRRSLRRRRRVEPGDRGAHGRLAAPVAGGRQASDLGGGSQRGDRRCRAAHVLSRALVVRGAAARARDLRDLCGPRAAAGGAGRR